MSKQIPTAEEFIFKHKFSEELTNEEKTIAIEQDIIKHDDYIDAMIEFGKMCAKKALEAARENSKKLSSTPDTIFNSYDLNNIK
jgi:hypothetical protein